MAITYVIYTATASQTDFNITFPYIDATHVYVDIDGVNTTAFTVESGPKVVLTSGASVGEKVKVYRTTPGRTATEKDLLVDYQDGSVLSEADLDKTSQQLLYLSQEAQETGASSLAIDWDDNYTAAGRRIKDLSGTVTGSNDATTKDYVDGIALYGGGASLPQSWAKTGANFSSAGGGTYTLNLTTPTPTSDNQDLFIVSINGVLQRPTTDFTVVESSGTYTLSILGWSSYASGDIVNIQNFGVSRNWIKQPIKGEADGDVSLTVQKRSASQSGDLQQWQNDSGTALAKVAVDGDATFVDVNATGNADVDGNLNVDGTAQIDGNTTIGSSKVTIAGATGNTDIVSGTLDVGGATTLDSTLGVAGETTLTGGVAGNLNILTGALQFAGNTGMTIRQIVSATYDTTAGSTHQVTDTANYKVYGMKVSITPQTSASKILLLANFRTYSLDTSAYSTGAEGFIVRNNTASAGATHNGTQISRFITEMRAQDDPDNSDEVYMKNTHSLVLLESPGSTSAVTYDITVRAASATDTVKCYVDSENSRFYAIEIA
jgi:hypothetical protein